MIKRSMLVGAAVILAWHLIMPLLPRAFYTIPGMQRANHLHAQHFVHDTPDGARVIVGSSMSERLDASALGEDHVKLTFPGGGPFTGMEIVRGTGRFPPVLWIETNVIIRDAEADLLADTLSPWRMKLREASPVFKERGRPSEYGVGFLKAAVGKVCKLSSKLLGEKPVPVVDQGLAGPVLAEIMEANRDHLSKVPEPAGLAERVGRMAARVDELSRMGCKVVFYEMPIDQSLENLAEPAAVRKAMKARFPSDQYLWLDLGREAPWQTTDGIHLVPDEADLVVRKMLDFEAALK